MPEPDYQGFCEHLEEWDKQNVCYSLRDMAELAVRYNCPIPDEMRERFRDLLERPEQA